MNADNVTCNLCGSTQLELIVEIRQKPARETDFGIAQNAYRRQVYRCSRCSVYVNRQNMVGSDIYGQEYNRATYNQRLLDTFLRIRELPLSHSDNKQRVQRVMEFNTRAGRIPENTSILDVGSGLCVFLAELKEYGFRCYAIDPDPHAVRHAIEHAKVDGAHVGTLDDFQADRRFNIIAFNKVLEHVPDPVRVLSQAKALLVPGGVIYVELPDGDSALRNGTAIDREEFYVEHLMVFTRDSIDFLTRAAGLHCTNVEEIHEPSDKYTIYAFLEK